MTSVRACHFFFKAFCTFFSFFLEFFNSNQDEEEIRIYISSHKDEEILKNV